jgi:hypothetical protein
MRNIEPGSTVVPLEVNADVMEWTEVRESLQLMSQVFSSPTRRSPIPEIPSSLALQFRKLANSLGPTETMEVIAAPNTSFPITRGLGRQIKGYGPGNRKTFEVREIAKVATGRESERIEAILQSLAAGVPKQEWERLPSDLSDELDHYLYGTPKK